MGGKQGGGPHTLFSSDFGHFSLEIGIKLRNEKKLCPKGSEPPPPPHPVVHVPPTSRCHDG